jgi:L-alanine-DL-glutamate epimerase-like enolase superfamily enzyme
VADANDQNQNLAVTDTLRSPCLISLFATRWTPRTPRQQPFVVRDGHLELPRGPGLGIELDEEAMAGRIRHDWMNREEHGAFDGSVMDW